MLNSEKLYTSIAKLYDLINWLNGYKRAADYFVRQLPFKTDASIRVLDAGCGTGLYSLAILKRFPNAQLVAFDLNEAMARKMETNLDREGFRKRAKVFVADAMSSLPEIEQNFDLIVAGGLLECVDIGKAVKNSSRFLIIGGYFLNSPVRDNIWGWVAGELMGFVPHSKQQNIRAFEQGGFKLQKIIKLSWLYLLISLVKEAHIFQKI
ncbi:MAG: class I SAM-dependent methyltransferase [Patescibacteria group bacterium]